MINDLLKLQEEIYKYEYEEHGGYDIWSSPRVSFSKMGELYEIVYFGDGYDFDPLATPINSDFPFAALLELIGKNSAKIKSLVFTGADTGANGVKNWDFTRLIDSGAIFENLTHFKVRLTDLGDHNQSIIAKSYDEGGQIAALAALMPNLEFLQVPSAPNGDFFKLKDLKLKELIVQAGFDTQDFIKNLARCDNLKNLFALDYTNILDDFDNVKTTYEDYKLLFESDFFVNRPVVRAPFHFTLRDAYLTGEQLLTLNAIKKIQFLHVNMNAGKYIRQ